MRADAQPSIGFQSTLPRGERHICCRKERFRPYFNPRSHEGSDLVYTGCSPILANFNPRSHEGSDWIRLIFYLPLLHFNPRSHEGSDLSTHKTENYCKYFNPRSHEGSDWIPPENDLQFLKFQSTLPRGERHYALDND